MQNLYDRIGSIDDKTERIKRQRLPRAHMELGKCKKRGDAAGAQRWEAEIKRLHELLNQQGKLRADLWKQINAGGTEG